jgi:hypothetical protein
MGARDVQTPVPCYAAVPEADNRSVANPRNHKLMSALAEQLNEAGQLHLERLHYIEERLARETLSLEA